MLSSKKLVQMVKKWQKMAVLGRRRLIFERQLSHHDADQCTSRRAEKGHFVVYAIDGKRFMIPLDYLNTRIVMQLFQLSEDEFDHTVDGPIMLPCEAEFVDYALGLIRRGMSEEIERALLSSVLLPHQHACSVQSNYRVNNQQVELCGL